MQGVQITPEGRDGSALETWYVVADTDAQVVNLVPAAVMGLRAIDRVLVLSGTTLGARERSADKAKAIDTQARFHEALMHEAGRLGLDKEFPIERITGDKDDLLSWVDLTSKFFEQRENVGRVVYAYTSGTKDMSIGACLGLSQLRERRPDIKIEFVAKQMHRVYWPFEASAVDLTGGLNYLSLGSYLLSRGFQEFDSDQSHARERLGTARRDITRALNEMVFDGTDQNLIDARLAIVTALGAQNNPVNLTRKVHHITSQQPYGQKRDEVKEDLASFVPALAKFLRNLDGCAIFEVSRETMIAFPSADTGGYVNGKWFEEWLWLGIRDQLADTQAEVKLGLQAISSASVDRGCNDFEFDVAIYANDQLHVVECKAGRSYKKEEIDRLSRAKTVVLGPFGKAWLIRAQSLNADAKGYEQAGRAELILATGIDQVNLMLDSVRRVVL